ncbi:MAG TPA: aminotransferase class V-fold PLP-dependent enzyme [Acidimicrobiales bacterium]|nr:aminotransferase class V-fold PLP-dependent enzyme [Acidimicrobiales bacterium]
MTGLPLELDAEQMAALGDAAMAFASSFVAERAIAPASNQGDPALPELLAALAASPGEAGRPLAHLLDLVGRAAAHGVDTAGPGYLGFIPGGGLFSAAVADFVTLVVNRMMMVPALGPALAQIEATAVRWLADLAGLPPAAGGILTSCGSMANFSAVVAARVDRLPEDFRAGTLYVTDQAHHSVAKSAMLAGFAAAAVRPVPTTADLHMDLGALAAMVADDRRAGRLPFAVVANAGTTNTGAVDPLDRLADLAATENLWLHVDAAYGGMFLLTERGRARFAGIARADSVTLDPHKGLFLPYGTGALVVRDSELLRRSHRVAAPYLPDADPTWSVPSFADLSPELSRELRGLRVWLPLQLHGVAAFRAALDEKLDLAAAAHGALRQVRDLELPWRPELSVVAFRHRDGDGATDDLLQRVNASGRVFLSSTTIAGRRTIRLSILSHRTHADRVEEAVKLVAQAASGRGSGGR